LFGWFKKKPTREDTEPFKMGERAGEEMIAAFDHLMTTRFAPVRENYLGILRDRLRAASKAVDVPPLTVARIELDVFTDEAKKLREKMLQNICVTLRGWLEVADQTDARSYMDELIQHRLDDYLVELTTSALRIVKEYAIPLKDADAAWRRANPRQAAQFPEEPPPEIGGKT